MEDRLLTIQELSEVLNIPVKTLYSYIQKPDFPYYKIEGQLRFKLKEVLCIYKSNTQSDSVRLLTTTNDSLKIEKEMRQRGSLQQRRSCNVKS